MVSHAACDPEERCPNQCHAAVQATELVDADDAIVRVAQLLDEGRVDEAREVAEACITATHERIAAIHRAWAQEA